MLNKITYFINIKQNYTFLRSLAATCTMNPNRSFRESPMKSPMLPPMFTTRFMLSKTINIKI